MPGLNAFNKVSGHDFTHDPAAEEAFDFGVERRVAEDVADDDATPEAPGGGLDGEDVFEPVGDGFFQE
jgi:hypothetical protein